MTKPGPGKFEFNNSEEESQILYEHSLDGSHPDFGESDTFGWYSLILGENLTETEKSVCGHDAYICKENSQGFFIIIPYNSVSEALKDFEKLEEEYNAFYATSK